MSGVDAHLVLAAVLGISLSIVLIVRARLHPFVGLLCGAFAVGLLAGVPAIDTAKAVQKGAGDILGGTGLVVALGLSLGAMLQLSGGAASLAGAALRRTGMRGAPWASLATGLLIGLPLFFETGLVLLMPIVSAAAAALPSGPGRDAGRLRVMLSGVAGLSVLHALVPPHPGPLLAVDALHANLARTIGYGVMVGIPTAIIAGPLLSKWTTRGVMIGAPVIDPVAAMVAAPPLWRSLLVVLAPVLLIAAGQATVLLPVGAMDHVTLLVALSNPVVALLVTNLVALPLLFGDQMLDRILQTAIWSETMKPAGAILLAIGAGGALKQVLVTAGLSDLLARLAIGGAISPILLAWLVAVGVRLATGSATVATITTAGIMPGLAAASGAEPEWIVLAIGAGSVFFSHVNDPGFWLVKGYLGTDTPATFRTWSVLETVVSVMGLLLVLAGSHVL